MSANTAVSGFVNPFPGLRAYEYSEYPLFFGREGQSLEILRRLGNRRFVSVIGISGSGKSSLIRAGLLPYLDNAYLRQAGSHWRKAIIRPGTTPIANLAAALTSVLTDPDNPMPPGFMDSTLNSGGLGLIKAVQYAHLPPQENVLIIVDQMEELFRFAKLAEDSRRFDQEDEASAFVKLLLEAVAQTEIPIYVVITMRSDFIGDCARFRDLPEAVNDGLYLIPRMIRDQRRQAIVGPIEAVGRKIAPRLVNRLLNDVGDSPDQLPLLQHALMRTFDRWVSDHATDEPIDLRHYEAIGGLTEALSRHADEAYSELPDDAHREIARRMFQSLTEKGPDGREVRRPSPVSEIMARTGAPFPQVARTIDTFRRAGRSFLMPPPDVPLDQHTVIDISHESLIGGWAQLRKWVDDEAQSAAVYRRLADTAALYQAGQAGLYFDPDLQIALSWRDRECPTEEWAHRYHPGFAPAMSFLDTSRDYRDAIIQKNELARRRELARSRTFAAVVAVFGLAAVLLALFAFYQKTIASQYAEKYKEAAVNSERAKQAAQAAETKALSETQKAANALQKQNEANAQLKIALDNATAATKQANLARDEYRQAAITSTNTVIQDQRSLSDLADSIINDETPRGSLRARRRKALGLSEIGDHSGSAYQETLVLSAVPDYPWALESLGYEYLLLGRIDESISNSEKFLLSDPHNAGVLQNLAIAKAIKGQYDDALDDINKAIKFVDPSSSGMFESELAPDVRATTGRLVLEFSADEFLLSLRYELAAIRALKGDPGFVNSLNEADAASKALGIRPDTALYTTLNWVWLHFLHAPKDYAAFAVAGAIWDRIGKYDRDFQGCSSLAYRRFQGDYQQAKDSRYTMLAHWVESQLSQAPQAASCGVLKSDDPRALAFTAQVLQNRMGNSKNMIQGSRVDKELSEAIDHASKNKADAGMLVGLLLRRLQFRYEANYLVGAKDDAERILAIHPVGDAYYYLALLATDPKDKEQNLEKAVELEPNDSGTVREYLDVLLSRDDSDVSEDRLRKALEVAQHYEQISNDPANAYRRIALIQHRLKDDQQALRSIQAAIDINPTQINLYDLRYQIEESLQTPRTIRVRHYAEGLRRAGDFSRSGSPGEALSLYLRGLRLLVAQLPAAGPDVLSQADSDLHFEIETSIRNISEYLARHYSTEYVRAFWTSAAVSDSMTPIRKRLSAEMTRFDASPSR